MPFRALTCYGSVLDRWEGGLNPIDSKSIRSREGALREWSGWWSKSAQREEATLENRAPDDIWRDFESPGADESQKEGPRGFDVLNRAGIIDIHFD